MIDEAVDPRVYTAVVADDLSSVRKLITRAVERTGYIEVVGEAADGNEALEVVAATHPDAVILDLVMPNRSGLEVVAELRELVPHAVIAVFSGLGAEIIQHALAGSEVDLYVDKQSSLDNFVAELMAELNVRRVTGVDVHP